MIEKRLVWQRVNTILTEGYNKEKEFLGFLKYERCGRYMHWCWYQMDGIMMSPGCLQEVRDKQKELVKK